MKTTLLLLALALTTGCSTERPKQALQNEKQGTRQEIQQNPAKEESTPLTEWNVVGDANWRISDEGFEANSGEGFLVTPEHYSDFTLEVEFYAAENSNSGIFFRCNSETEISDQNCYEANIFDHCPAEHAPCRTGALTKIAPPAVAIDAEGQWNKYVIEARGSSIRIVLNGQEVVNVEDGRHASGPIALQLKQGGIQFRNVKIKRSTQ